MLSPFTFRTYDSLFPTKSIEIGRVSSMFSTAKIGEPAVTVPIMGKFIISFLGMSLHISSTSIISKALLLFVPFFMYPLSSNVFKWA